MEKVITTKSFIGGRLVYPGEMVDVDAKGAVLPAHSTPVGQMTIDQLEATLDARRREAGKSEPQFGSNVADPTEQNTGSQDAEIASFRPAGANAVHPQALPPGTVPHAGGFIRPASPDAPAAIEELVPASNPFDHDGDGQPGGSVPADPPSLAGKNKAQLLKIAADEGAAADDGMTNAQIVQSIEAKRGNG